MPLAFQVTAAGRAALVNAANTGTLPVFITQVGVTATAFTAAADGSDLALPGEIKRLATFGGAAVADDTIHAVIRDDSADVYTMRGFGLYLGDGTLFGLYGQADPILEKSAGAVMMLANDVIFADIDAASLTFGDASFLNPPATVDTAGVVELATDAEAIAGVDATRAVTPKGLVAKLTALLGAGAPSTFVKTLLTAVDLVAFRTLLAIKTAASYDIGVGNGLDADLLDGQHGAYYLAWGNQTGVPATFTPSAHQHSAADITSGLLGVARGGTGAGALTAGSYLIGNGTGPVALKTPAQVLADIGASPVVHSHAISDVNGLQGALDARPVQTAVTAQIIAAVNGLINGSPGALDTLNELAAAMGNDANFAATVTNALAGKQPILGFSPVQQGTGVGQASNMVKIGWDGVGKLKLTIDATDLGNLATESWTGDNFISNGELAAALAAKASLNANVAFGSITFAENLISTTVNAVIATTDAGTVYLRPNGVGSTVGQVTVNAAGNLVASGSVTGLTINGSTSDIRLKTDVQCAAPRPLHRLLAALPDTHGALTSYIHRVDGAYRLGPIAQDMERVEPAYMGTVEIVDGQVEGIDAGTYKTVDKSSAAYEQAMWAGQEIDGLHAVIDALQQRLAALESR